jgi:peptide/nickel transport system ATP-binding protein
MALLEVSDLQVQYETVRGPFKAVDGVSFSIRRGELFGLVGESGCGKSTTAYALSRLLKPPAKVTGGSIAFDGRELTALSDAEFDRIRWSRIPIVLQNAMSNLNPVMRIGAQLIDVLQAHRPKLTKAQAVAEAARALELVDLPKEKLHRYPHELSGGMRQRVVIAMALLLKPDLIIMDEPTTALDVITQQGIVSKIVELKREFGFAVLFITHDLPLLLEFCDRVGVMYAGKMVEISSREELLKGGRHPYTQGLLQSFPSLHGPKVRLKGIPGLPPDLISPPQGCRFQPRCGQARPECGVASPGERFDEKGFVSCHLYGQGGAAS